MTNIRHTLLEHIINEGRLEDTIKKYTDKLPEPVIRELSAADPSGNNKYLDWMTNVVVQAPRQKADIIEKIKCFHENVERLSDKHTQAIYGNERWHKPSAEDLTVLEKIRKTPKDINVYPSHLWIQPMCDYFEEQKPKNASRVKIYEDDKWLVVSPLTHAASCSYGAHSNWCVSTSNSSYFSNYTSEAILVFFLDKKGHNPKKKSANIYKFAVNIRYDSPGLGNWEWYTMEDARIDANLMMNLVPKMLLDKVEAYLVDVLKEVNKKSTVNEEELEANSEIWYKQGNIYTVFPKFENWDEASMRAKSAYLEKYAGGKEQIELLPRYKDVGLPFFTLQFRTGRIPSVSLGTIQWNTAKSTKRAENNQILKSRVIEQFNSRWGGLGHILDRLDATNKNKLYNLYIKMFNEVDFSENSSVRTTELNVGDNIIQRPYNRMWGAGENVRIEKVNEKSLTLSNGKRIARTPTSYKEKLGGKLKIIDDTVKTESRWIRTRII